jgi:hypothetical protein
MGERGEVGGCTKYKIKNNKLKEAKMKTSCYLMTLRFLGRHLSCSKPSSSLKSDIEGRTTGKVGKAVAVMLEGSGFGGGKVKREG